ncbi:Ff.00g091930.m01.CDS01 [Fusarium sp. VM40]|nr:Ff.00g091930.m01.CDS01 [Fusarium sp. VM40]
MGFFVMSPLKTTSAKVAELAQLKSEASLCLLRAELSSSIIGLEDRFDRGRTPRSYANGPHPGRLGGQNSAVDFAAFLKASGSREHPVSPSRQPQPAPALTYQQLPHKLSNASPRLVAHVAPTPGISTQMSGRRGMPPHASDQPPVKKQSKWSPEEDTLIIELRGKGMKWEDISKRLPGRSAISCRLHYQNYLERRSEWDEERKNKLARLYERFKPEMWAKVAEEMAVPWRAAEAMHWQLGEADMARRAGVIPFSLAAVNVEGNSSHRGSPSRSHVHSQSQSSISRDLGAPSPRMVYNRPPPMPASNRTMAPRRESIPPPPPLPMGPDLAEVQYVPGPGLAPIQNQPPPRSAGMLPGVAELTGGVSPYSTPAAAPNLGPMPGVGPGSLYSSLASYSMESAGNKRKASPDHYQHEANQRRRIV